MAGIVGEWVQDTEEPGWAAWITGTAFTLVACIFARRLRVTVVQLEAAQHQLAERSRAEERTRIAGEMHDVIGHALTVSLLHISSARLALDEDPDEARRALEEAERLSAVQPRGGPRDGRTDAHGCAGRAGAAAGGRRHRPARRVVPQCGRRGRPDRHRRPRVAGLGARARGVPDRPGGPDQRGQARTGRARSPSPSPSRTVRRRSPCATAATSTRAHRWAPDCWACGTGRKASAGRLRAEAP